MPFGLTVAPEIFQTRLHDAIADLLETFAIADDIFITGDGDTYDAAIIDHDQKTERLLHRCQERAKCLNLAKLRLRLQNVSYMSHLLTNEGLKPDPKKIEAIQK